MSIPPQNVTLTLKMGVRIYYNTDCSRIGISPTFYGILNELVIKHVNKRIEKTVLLLKKSLMNVLMAKFEDGYIYFKIQGGEKHLYGLPSLFMGGLLGLKVTKEMNVCLKHIDPEFVSSAEIFNTVLDIGFPQ